MENINNKLKECENKEQYRIYGELITANLYQLNNSTSSITVQNYYDNNKEIEIPLDNTISPHKNADKYFKKYTKLKSTLQIVSKQKKITEKELEYIESIIYSLEIATCIEDIENIKQELIESSILGHSFQKSSNTSKKISNNEPLEYKVNGYTVLAGKNNVQNDYLTLKLASKEDIWFHTQTTHGSHIILKTNGKPIDESTLIECAKIAVINSKAKLSSNVAVDYTYVKNVKKPSGSKPGMVVYTNYKTIFVK